MKALSALLVVSAVNLGGFLALDLIDEWNPKTAVAWIQQPAIRFEHTIPWDWGLSTVGLFALCSALLWLRWRSVTKVLGLFVAPVVMGERLLMLMTGWDGIMSMHAMNWASWWQQGYPQVILDMGGPAGRCHWGEVCAWAVPNWLVLAAGAAGVAIFTVKFLPRPLKAVTAFSMLSISVFSLLNYYRPMITPVSPPFRMPVLPSFWTFAPDALLIASVLTLMLYFPFRKSAT